MPRSSSVLAASVVLVAGCAQPPDAAPARAASGPPQASEIVFQAVDAGTGAALTDDDLTVRYLVRAPITLDTFVARAVPAAEAYHIEHEISEDSLVVELRLEAPSYHRLDTVLSVPKGASAGPVTLRMARRLERAASAEDEGRAGARRPDLPGSTGTPSPPAPAGHAPESASTPSSRLTAMEAGDRAFQAGRWRTAVAAYGRMSTPTGRDSVYAADYEAALVRQGIANIRLGAYDAAIQALRKAVATGLPDARAHLRLAQAQCAAGRPVLGRITLEGIRDMGGSIPDADKPVIRALVEYQTALCSQQEIDGARTSIERVRSGNRALREFQAFFQAAADVSPSPPELEAAVADGRSRVEDIRRQMRAGGGDA
ncbi:MAG: hypothetical protein PVJ02_14350 [Gemmatimonadota bacterium]|jgi:hypothetical protein